MNIGFIGIGNMGGAFIDGLLESGCYNVYLYDLDMSKIQKYKSQHVFACDSIKDISDKSEILFLTVKPNVYSSVLEELALFNYSNILISVAPGITTQYISSIVNTAKVVRIMPNTPAMVGEGMTLISKTDSDLMEKVKPVLEKVGKLTVLPESMMDYGTALSGSSPALIYQLIDGMANAALSYGIPKEEGIKIAAQTVLGSAKMVLETGEHPQKLSDKVCSPGGTTIEMVNTLKKCGFDKTIVESFDACVKKAQQMKK